MYPIDPNATNVSADANNTNNNNGAPSIVLSEDGDDDGDDGDDDELSQYTEADAEEENSQVTTMYEEETVASGQSAPAHLGNQLAFASSLQQAAAFGPWQQSLEQQKAYEAL